MSLAWPMLAAVGAAGATWLYEWSPARNPPDSGAVRSCDLPLPLILEMLSVAIRQGASIPRALIAVGNIVEGEFGGGLRSAGERLNSGMPLNSRRRNCRFGCCYRPACACCRPLSPLA